MDVLLIGGTGFLGSHLTRGLLAAGYRVATLTRGTRDALEGAEPLVAERDDEAALARALEGRRFDLTVDLAAYDAPDVEKVFRVRRLALGRYVLVSTGQVYLVTSSERSPFREGDSVATLLPEPPAGSPDHREWTYGIGKRRAEQALRNLRGSHGVRGTILRLPVLIGEGDTSLRFWAYLERLLDGGPLVLPDGGARSVRFLYPGDVAHALFRWIEHGLPTGPVYNLAQPEIATLRQAIESMAHAAGVTPRFVDASWEQIERAGLTRSFSPYGGSWVSVLDPERATTQWGFSGTPMDEYLPRVVRWTLEHRPAASHPGYAQRRQEIELAETLGRTRESVRS